MDSPKKTNYETRPVKFTERKMLLSCISKICNYFKDDYQYIGLGGLSFTDFKIFHKELHIDEMHSIEGGSFSIEKLKFNSPYSFIKIHKEITSVALTQLDLTKKTFVWLDYDGCLDNYMFDDLSILINKLPIGSIYLMSCNRELKNKDSVQYSVDEFSEKFGNLVPIDIKNTDFSGTENHKTIRRMFTNFIKKIIKDRNRNDESIAFTQLFNILYEENRGARMYTFGGIITSSDQNIEDLNLSNFNFISQNEDSFKIDIPNITFKEFDLINQHLGDIDDFEKLKKLNIVSENDIKKYQSSYKYLPVFFDVRI
ncbi:hypothetical protein SY27_15280 [Flavobacterium sp. 316]|uniref:O-methyltransferase n=1 Tax=Flavobacterium sp. 316 TaxID=1603293 RepID=UPI0005E2FD14|nr:O-methyltransferase [Flavobacterium sp. 316]KIX19893.1 hypothetical protein SY27_15280 [Flavobacterium sp. 316]